MMKMIFILLATVLVSYYDIKYYRIPNFISIGFWLFWGSYLAVTSRSVPVDFLISSAVAFGSYLLVYFISRKRMGLGDVKLALFLGGLGNVVDWYWVNVYAAGLALLVFLILLMFKRVNKNSRIPFGVFMCTGTILRSLF